MRPDTNKNSSVENVNTFFGSDEDPLNQDGYRGADPYFQVGAPEPRAAEREALIKDEETPVDPTVTGSGVTTLPLNSEKSGDAEQKSEPESEQKSAPASTGKPVVPPVTGASK